MGPMPWTINSEIYPQWARSAGNACSAGTNWVFNVIVSLTFLTVAQTFTTEGEERRKFFFLSFTSATFNKLLLVA